MKKLVRQSKHDRGRTSKDFSQTPEVWSVCQVVHKACGRSQDKKMKHSIHAQKGFVAVTVQMQNKVGKFPDGGFFFFWKLIRECNSTEEIAEQTDKINSKYWLKISEPSGFAQEV